MRYDVYEVIFVTTGQRIKIAREKANMTQAELAQKLGISFQSISQWERDIRIPKKETLKSIANALGVDPLELSNDLFDHAFLALLQKTFGDNEDFRTAFLDGSIQLALLRKDNDLRLYTSYIMLNEEGQQLAVDYVFDLTEKPEYLSPLYRLSRDELRELQERSKPLPYPKEESPQEEPVVGKKETPQD